MQTKVTQAREKSLALEAADSGKTHRPNRTFHPGSCSCSHLRRSPDVLGTGTDTGSTSRVLGEWSCQVLVVGLSMGGLNHLGQ